MYGMGFGLDVAQGGARHPGPVWDKGAPGHLSLEFVNVGGK